MNRTLISLLAAVALVSIVFGCGGGGPSGNAVDSGGVDIIREAPVNPDDLRSDAIEPTRPGSLPPGLAEHVFVRYGPGHPTFPAHTGTCSQTTTDPDNNALLSFTLPAGGIQYKINPATVPASVSSGFAQAIADGFQTWTSVDSDSKFSNPNGATTPIKSSKLDGTNLIAFGTLQAGVIAVTRVWSYTATGIVAEVDEIFSKRFPWSINSYNGQAANDCAGTANTMDVQNIHTHEVGHFIGLGHPTPHAQTEDLTMHAYAAYGELKRRTLGKGDIIGAGRKIAK